MRTLAVLMGMHVGAATVKNNMEHPQKFESETHF